MKYLKITLHAKDIVSNGRVVKKRQKLRVNIKTNGSSKFLTYKNLGEMLDNETLNILMTREINRPVSGFDYHFNENDLNEIECIEDSLCHLFLNFKEEDLEFCSIGHVNVKSLIK